MLPMSDAFYMNYLNEVLDGECSVQLMAKKTNLRRAIYRIRDGVVAFVKRQKMMDMTKKFDWEDVDVPEEMNDGFACVITAFPNIEAIVDNYGEVVAKNKVSAEIPSELFDIVYNEIKVTQEKKVFMDLKKMEYVNLFVLTS